MLILLAIKMLGFKMSSTTLRKQTLLSRAEQEMKQSCINVSGNMVIGSWVKDNRKEAEMADLVNFHREVRAHHGMHQTLQRKDNLCGNVNLDGSKSWFRALCDPNGSMPCCFENKCVTKSLEQCRCKDCYDLRQKLHAELSTWIPANPTCQITMFAREEDLCKVLRDLTIYFMGDSIMRQLYMAVLSLIRKDKPDGILINHTPTDKIQQCSRHYALPPECIPWTRTNTNECNNRMRLRSIAFWKASQTDEMLKYVKELQGQPNSIIVMSLGIHDNFNLNVVENQILKPLLLTLASSAWPKLIWLSAQSAGLLKSPNYRYQQQDNIIKFNNRVNDIMKTKHIPVLDFFQITESVISYDGTHYGKGVNELKTQVLLNFILEMRTNASGFCCFSV